MTYMKKYLLLLVGVLLIGTSAVAQGKRDFKKANRMLGSYNLDPGANADKLEEAKTLIAKALEDEEVQGMAKAWIVKGKIYNEAVGREMNQKILNPDYEVKNVGDADIAFESFKKALETAEKKFETKEALNGLQVTAGHISNAAITAFQNKEYETAFSSFEHSLELDDILTSNDEASTFPDEAIRGEQLFYTAISGYYAEKYDEVEPYFLKAKELDSPDPFIYEGLYNMKKESDPEVAFGFLTEGREKYPDDTALLYAEINYLVAQGKLEQLIVKLEDAVEKDPENLSVYTTLGSVYDNLASKMAKDSMVEKSKEYFDRSEEWFKKALEKDEKNFDALYSLGALYYNKAATYTDPLNELANDFSAEGNRKYEALKAEMDAIFEKAFPYFQQAEEVNPNDTNTLLAIKEIYARKGNIEKSNEYKAKLEALNN